MRSQLRNHFWQPFHHPSRDIKGKGVGHNNKHMRGRAAINDVSVHLSRGGINPVASNNGKLVTSRLQPCFLHVILIFSNCFGR